VWGLVFAIYLGTIVVSLVLFILVVRPGGLNIHVKFFELDHPIVRALGWTVFLAILVLIPYVRFVLQIGRSDKNPFTDAVLLGIVYYWICWYALLLAMVALKLALRTTWHVSFVTAMILLGVVYEVQVRFNAVTTYPLSMGWSEGSRYYYASLYFSKWVYGEAAPLPSLHPSRYLLQSILFRSRSNNYGASFLAVPVVDRVDGRCSNYADEAGLPPAG
jgi:hypothetical protein